MIRSQADVYAERVDKERTVAALWVGLARTAPSAVTAVMEEYVMQLQGTAPVGWAGQVIDVIKSVPEAGMGLAARKCVTVEMMPHVTELQGSVIVFLDTMVISVNMHAPLGFMDIVVSFFAIAMSMHHVTKPPVIASVLQVTRDLAARESVTQADLGPVVLKAATAT